MLGVGVSLLVATVGGEDVVPGASSVEKIVGETVSKGVAVGDSVSKSFALGEFVGSTVTGVLLGDVVGFEVTGASSTSVGSEVTA